MIYSAITGGKDNPRTDGIKTFGEYDRFKHPRLNAKIYKVLSHKYIDDEWSIWIDGNMKLKKTEKELIEMANGNDVAVFRHLWSKSVYDEAEAVIKQGLDHEDIVREQIERYKEEGFESNDMGMCFMIIRRHTEEVKRLNEKWWAEICRGSSRDQLSFPYIFRDAYYMDHIVELGNNFYWDNEFYYRFGHNKPSKI